MEWVVRWSEEGPVCLGVPLKLEAPLYHPAIIVWRASGRDPQ